LTNHAGNALVTLLADARRPPYRGVLPDHSCPVGAHFGEKVGEDIGCSASIRAIDRQYLIVRKIDAGIIFGNARIIPSGDLAEVDVSNDVAGEVELLIHARNVVDRNDSAEDSGDVHQLDLGSGKLLIGHGAVTGAEVDRSVGGLTNAATRAD
jgi:hypothetical protein